MENEETKKDVTVEEIEAVVPKVRALHLDPIIIATFGDLSNQMKDYLNYLYKATGYTFPSRPQVYPDG